METPFLVFIWLCVNVMEQVRRCVKNVKDLDIINMLA